MKSPNLFKTDYPTAPSLPCVFWLWSTITWSFNVIIVWNVSIFSPSYKQLCEILAAVWDVLWGLSFVSLTCNKQFPAVAEKYLENRKCFMVLWHGWKNGVETPAAWLWGCCWFCRVDFSGCLIFQGLSGIFCVVYVIATCSYLFSFCSEQEGGLPNL